MPAPQHRPRAPGAPRGLTFDLGAKPQGLFVPAGELADKVWDPFAPLWGPVVKCGITSQFDEVTYAQMLDDLQRRDLRVYMDQDHRTASAGWSMDHVDIPALAFYCNVTVAHEGKLWRSVDLMGHSCAAAVPFDLERQPEGMAGFRCQVTPLGRQVLENYQALSIHFDPYGEDLQGHPTGQVLLCVSAVNGPHIAGARPTGGQFSSNKRYFDMNVKKRKLFALAKDEGGDAGGEAPETKDLSVEMAELCKELGLPEGSAPESIIGAALATVKAGKGTVEPDGDEEPPAMAEDLPADSMKYMGDDEKAKPFARAAAMRFSAPRRALGALAKELGVKPGPVSVLKAFVAFKARSADAGELTTALGRIKALEDERAKEKAEAREAEIEAIFQAAGPDGAGLINTAKIEELRAQAKKYNASPADVKTWLPRAEDITFTAGGAPKGKGGPSQGAGADRVRGAEQAQAIQDFRAQYQKDTGKRIKHDMAGRIVGGFYQRGEKVDYAKAKAEADRLPADAFLKKEAK